MKQRPYTWNEGMALAGIIAVNLLLKFRYFSGLVWADDFSYGVYAYLLFGGGYAWDMALDFRALRLSMLLPVAVLFRILPQTEFVAVLYPMILSLGTIVVVYLIGRRLISPVAGLAAAAVYATFPADVLYSTMLLPDIIVPFFLSLAVLAFLIAEGAGDGRRAKAWFALSGAAVFLAFIARENSYYFALFYVPFVFSAKRWRRGLYWAIAGFAVPVVLLYGFYFVKTGDFLFELHLAQTYRDPLIASGYIPPNEYNWLTHLYYLFPALFPGRTGRLNLMSGTFGLTFLLAVPFLVYLTAKGIWRWRWKLLIVPWWVVVSYLFLEFGSITFDRYQMMQKLPRFLLILTPGVAIAYGAGLADIAGLAASAMKSRRKRAAAAVLTVLGIAVLVLHGYSMAVTLDRQHGSLVSNVEKFRWAYYGVLEDEPHLPVYQTGGWWVNKLSFYYLPDTRYAETRWSDSDMLRDMGTVNDPAELGGSHVIIDRSHFTGANDLRVQYTYDEFGTWMQLPPPEWTLLGMNGDVELYEVPDGWAYREPDPRDLALGSFRFALETNDLMLAIYQLHPSEWSPYVVDNRLSENFAAALARMREIANAEPGSADFARIGFETYAGKQKLIFNLE